MNERSARPASANSCDTAGLHSCWIKLAIFMTWTEIEFHDFIDYMYTTV